jgi:hypothetical protein
MRFRNPFSPGYRRNISRDSDSQLTETSAVGPDEDTVMAEGYTGRAIHSNISVEGTSLYVVISL